MSCNFFTDRNKALKYLLDKYEVSGCGTISEGSTIFKMADKEVALLPWRVERRFIELKNLIGNHTLEDVSTLRFCRIDSADDASLDDLIYQELDLCEWLGGAKVVRVFGVFNGQNAANIIVKLENDISCSIECSVMLPEGAEVIDRHEIIARRGVASDTVVDTQVPQSSVYTYNNREEKRFTDVDAEIFGLSYDDVNIVRSAFQAVSEPEIVETWNVQHERLLEMIKDIKKSEATKTPAKMGDK